MEQNLLLKIIRDLSYDSAFAPLKVLSKQFFSSVFMNMYADKPEQVSTIVFGDFDKLHQINQDYGYDEGTAVMKKVMEIAYTIFPKSTEISRVAGDEFAFIIEGIDSTLATEYIKQLKIALESQSAILHHINVTFSAIDSRHSDSICDAYKKAEESVSKQKLNSGIRSVHTIKTDFEFWTSFESEINKSLNCFLDSLRFSKQFTSSATQLNHIFHQLSVRYFDKFLNYNHSVEKSADPLPNDILSPLEATQIHKLVTSEGENENLIEQVSISSLTNLANFLTKNPNTKQFSMTCFEKFILPKLDFPLDACYFSTSFLKVANTIQGHIHTDAQITSISSYLQKALSAKCTFNDLSTILETLENSDFLITLNGIDFLLLGKNVHKLDTEEIQNIVENVNQHSPILKLVSTTPQAIDSPAKLTSYLDEVEQDCSLQKDILKLNFVNTPVAINAFHISLVSCFDSYYQHFGSSSMQLEHMNRFMNMITDQFSTILKQRNMVDPTVQFAKTPSNLSTKLLDIVNSAVHGSSALEPR